MINAIHFKVDIKNNADLTVRFRPFFKVLNGNKEIYRDYLMSKRISYIVYLEEGKKYPKFLIQNP